MWDDTGHVYIARLSDGLYKIGRTVNLSARIISLRVRWPGIYYVHAIASQKVKWLEKRLHLLFAKSCKGDECFRLTRNDMAKILHIHMCDDESQVPDWFGPPPLMGPMVEVATMLDRATLQALDRIAKANGRTRRAELRHIAKLYVKSQEKREKWKSAIDTGHTAG